MAETEAQPVSAGELREGRALLEAALARLRDPAYIREIVQLEGSPGPAVDRLWDCVELTDELYNALKAGQKIDHDQALNFRSGVMIARSVLAEPTESQARVEAALQTTASANDDFDVERELAQILDDGSKLNPRYFGFWSLFLPSFGYWLIGEKQRGISYLLVLVATMGVSGSILGEQADTTFWIYAALQVLSTCDVVMGVRAANGGHAPRGPRF